MITERPDLDRVLSCPTLPSLPSVGLEVLSLTRNPNVSVEAIAKVIEMDPALSAKVLKTVNSSIYGLKDRCTTIRRALGYLGLAAVKSLVLGFSLMESARGVTGDGGIDMDGFWRRAIYSAAGARTIAQFTHSCDPDEAFTAALFQDLGALAMCTAIAPEYAAALGPDLNDHAKHPALEEANLGFTHMQAGAALAAKWKLPDRYTQVIEHHHNADNADPQHRPLVRTVALGTGVALVASGVNQAQAVADLVNHAHEWFGTSQSDLESLVTKIGAAATELAKMFDKSIGKPVNIRAVMEQARDEMLMQQISVSREAEDLRARNQTLQHQAFTDGLTGLGNRKRFDDESTRLFAEASSNKSSLGVIMGDGDKFKSVNDTHGHHVGDAVLKELARRISDAAGTDGLCFRYGGEEFAVLVPGADAARTAVVAERIRATIAGSPFDLSSVEKAPPTLPITASFGVAAIEVAPSFASFSSMLEAADRALYQAKHSGRNRVCQDQSAPAPGAAPASKPASVPGPPMAIPASSQPSGNKRVMLIEDDALCAKLIITLLQRTKGVEAEWVRDGHAALKRIGECAVSGAMPDVILCDVGLPGSDGLAVLRAVRACPRLASMSVIMFSARFDDATAAACRAAGATTLLNKSDFATDLVGWITRITGEFTARRAA